MTNYIDILTQSFRHDFVREVCVLYTQEHGFFSFKTDNQWGKVKFDFEKVWELLILSQFQSITMIHTHPPGVTGMSSIDRKLVQAWSMALGKDIHFYIFPENLDYLVYNKIERINKKTIVNDSITINLVVNKPLRLLQESMLYFSQGTPKSDKEFKDVLNSLNHSKMLKNSIKWVNFSDDDEQVVVDKEEKEESLGTHINIS